MLTATFYSRNFKFFSKFNISSIYTSSQRYITAEGRLKIQQVAVKVKKTVADSLQVMISSLKAGCGINYRQPKKLST